jgi:hypothetical protein
MNNYPKANVAGIFRKLLAEDWLIQSYGGAMKYIENGILKESSAFEPVYSYGHNYSKFDKDFSLFMWTPSSNKQKVSDYFDDIVRGLTEKDINKVLDKSYRFNYVDKEYK